MPPKSEALDILKWLIISLLVMLLLAFPLTFLCRAFGQEPTPQPIMACADLSDWDGQISIYNVNRLVVFDTTPRTLDPSTVLEWQGVAVDYYAAFEPLKYSKTFTFEAVINFTGTDAHLWIVSDNGQSWAWPFASYELGRDGNVHPCGAFEIEQEDYQSMLRVS